MRNALIVIVAAFALTAVQTTVRASEETDHAVSGCDTEAAFCTCRAPKTSSECKLIVQHCADTMRCTGEVCTCRYWPGFLGGPRRRN